MGTHKKEANRKVREGKTGDGMGNVKVKGENFYRYVPYRYAPQTLRFAAQSSAAQHDRVSTDS